MDTCGFIPYVETRNVDVGMRGVCCRWDGMNGDPARDQELDKEHKVVRYLTSIGEDEGNSRIGFGFLKHIPTLSR